MSLSRDTAIYQSESATLTSANLIETAPAGRKPHWHTMQTHLSLKSRVALRLSLPLSVSFTLSYRSGPGVTPPRSAAWRFCRCCFFPPLPDKARLLSLHLQKNTGGSLCYSKRVMVPTWCNLGAQSRTSPCASLPLSRSLSPFLHQSLSLAHSFFL